MSSTGGARFTQARRAEVRSPAPWNRLAYIVAALPRGIEALVPDLGVGHSERVLDYGSADSPYRDLFPGSVELVGADLPGNADADLDLAPDGSVPAGDGSFDAVLSTQVLEHVADPTLYLSECHRLLKPGGRMLLSTHGLMVYHPDPDDYWRWTGAGLRKAVTDAGFEVRRFEGILGLAGSAVQLLQDALYWKLPRPLRPLMALGCQTFIRLLDRFEDPKSKRMNALVFVLIAEKP